MAALPFLHDLIEQPATGDQVPQRRLEPLGAGRLHQIGNTRDRAIIVVEILVFVFFVVLAFIRGSAVHRLALFVALVIVIIDIDAVIIGVVFLVLETAPDRRLDGAEGRRRGSICQRLDRFDTVLLEDALYTANGVALAVEQPANSPEQTNVVRAIIAASAAPLHRLDLREARFPKPQNVLGNIEVFSDLTDGSERIRRLV